MTYAFIQEAIDILKTGGWLMIPLIFLAIFIYYTAFQTFFYFSCHSFYKTNKKTLARWVQNPLEAKGEIRAIIDYAQESIKSTFDVENHFAEIRNIYLDFPDRRRAFLMILITTAPLMGLLGTVTGMLTTFKGLASAGGGDTVDQIAKGISEALITTQTGLIIAIPAYVIGFLILKRRNEMDSCLTALESMSIQAFEKTQKNNHTV